MSFIRWLIPVALFACLGGFLVGNLVPRAISDQSMCWRGVNCGAVGSIYNETKPVKTNSGAMARPALLSQIGTARRGENVQILLQTEPGAVCAIQFEDANNHKTTLSPQFADKEGRCSTMLAVPADAAVGQANLLICASACLPDEDWPYFIIQ